MLRALLKKQFLELNAFYFQDKKTGKNRSKGSTAMFILLFAAIFAMLAVAFGSVGFSLAQPLNESGLSWLYFSLMGSLSLALGVFGSVFNTYASVYKAKDNELLLSMPVEPSKILLTRLIGVYAMGMLYESLVFIPSCVTYFIVSGTDALKVISCVILWVIIGLLILVLTCLCGWVVATISSKIKNKSFITVISSLAFLAIYYIVYFRLVTFIQDFALYSEKIGASVRRYAYPLYMLGKAALGDIVSLLIITVAAILLSVLCALALSKSFINITTSEESSSGKAKNQKIAQSGVSSALLRKELRHLASSPTYMLNCALGTILMPLTAVAAAVKSDFIVSAIKNFGGDIPGIENALPFIACIVICLLSAMNDLTAPSVSLEGKNIWIIQSMPVDTRKVLDSKRNLHLAVTLPPMIISSVIIHIAVGSGVVTTVLGTIFSAVFVFLSAETGLFLNLKMPNLSWKNEAVPVKQSMAVMIALFGGWIIVMIIAGIYMALMNVISVNIFLAVCIAVISAPALLIDRWVKTKGIKIFDELT